jgi:hypothetical protein
MLGAINFNIFPKHIFLSWLSIVNGQVMVVNIYFHTYVMLFATPPLQLQQNGTLKEWMCSMGKVV